MLFTRCLYRYFAISLKGWTNIADAPEQCDASHATQALLWNSAAHAILRKDGSDAEYAVCVVCECRSHADLFNVSTSNLDRPLTVGRLLPSFNLLTGSQQPYQSLPL